VFQIGVEDFIVDEEDKLAEINKLIDAFDEILP